MAGASDEARLRALFDLHPAGVCELAPDGRVVAANGRFATFAGADRNALVGQHLTELLDEHNHATARRLFERALGGERIEVQLSGTARDAETRHVDVTALPITEGETVVGVHVVVQDRTELHESTVVVAEQEAQVRGLFDGSPYGLAIVDLEGRYLRVNPTFERILGRDADELLGTPYSRWTHPDDRGGQATVIEQLLAEGRADSFVKRYLRPDGSEVWVRLTPSLIRDQQGRPRQMVASVEDVTEQRVADQLAERQRRLTSIAGRVAHLGGWAVDLENGTRSWTEEVYATLGHPDPAGAAHDDELAERSLDRYLPEDRQRIEAAFRDCVQHGRPFDLRLRIRGFDGRRRWARVVGEPERGSDGRVARVVGAFQDVTASVAAQEATDALQQRLTRTLEEMDEGLILLDRAGRFTYVNPHAELLLRFPADRLLGRPVWDPEIGIAGTAIGAAVAESIAAGEPTVIEELHDEPRGRWLTFHLHPSEDGLAAYVRDVTGQRLAREALEERERRLAEQAALLDEAQDAIVVTDLDDRVTFFNRGAQQLYGHDLHQALGQPARELLGADGDVYDEARRTLLSEGRFAGELRHRTVDGRELAVEARWTLVRDPDGTPSSVLTLNRDVTERRRLEQQAMRAQRVESLGTLASGIAHDLNNTLAPILLSTQLLLAEEDDEERREVLTTIETSAKRGADMVSQVLSFARGVDGQRVRVKVRELFDEVARLVGETFPKHVDLTLDVEADVGDVAGDPTQLHQVLVNLAVNARDAMRDHAEGRLALRASPVVLDDRGAQRHGLGPGEYVRIDVSDTGPGMPPSVAERIFEPFFTTKAPGEGTGLGLPTSRAIITAHEGEIEVTSWPGHGTRFTLWLPRCDTAIEPEPAATEVAPVGAGELVLVVDDEPEIRRIATRTLRAAGYEVITAADGQQALARFEERPDEIAVVLTDVVMPRMDGVSTVRALRRRRPDLPIVASSGLGEQLRDDPDLRRVAAQLHKPYSAEQLRSAIGTALHGTPRSAVVRQGQVDAAT